MNSLSSIAVPYSEALLELSKKLGLISETNKDLLLVSDILSQSVVLKNFLINPLVDVKAKKNVIRQLLFSQVENHVLVFLFILVERRRIILIDMIINCYANLASKSQAVVIVNISTAIALTDMQQSALESKLKSITKSKVIKLMINMKPDLLGGLVIKIGSKIIDTSLLGQINRMTSYLSIAQR